MHHNQFLTALLGEFEWGPLFGDMPFQTQILADLQFLKYFDEGLWIPDAVGADLGELLRNQVVRLAFVSLDLGYLRELTFVGTLAQAKYACLGDEPTQYVCDDLLVSSGAPCRAVCLPFALCSRTRTAAIIATPRPSAWFLFLAWCLRISVLGDLPCSARWPLPRITLGALV